MPADQKGEGIMPMAPEEGVKMVGEEKNPLGKWGSRGRHLSDAEGRRGKRGVVQERPKEVRKEEPL